MFFFLLLIEEAQHGLCHICRCDSDSVLTGRITSWYGNDKTHGHKAQQMMWKLYSISSGWSYHPYNCWRLEFCSLSWWDFTHTTFMSLYTLHYVLKLPYLLLTMLTATDIFYCSGPTYLHGAHCYNLFTCTVYLFYDLCVRCLFITVTIFMCDMCMYTLPVY